jgi:hypothetical protein
VSLFGDLGTLDPSFYSDWTVTFYPPDPGSETRGDPLAGLGTGVSMGASVELKKSNPTMQETHGLPDAREFVQVLTAADPGAGSGWHVAWDGRTLLVVGGSLAAAAGGPYRTWCVNIA